MNPSVFSTEYWKVLLRHGLEEDGFQLDWTTRGALSSASPSRISRKATVFAKQKGVWAASGLGLAVELLSAEMGSPLKVESSLKNGDSLTEGQEVSRWSGAAEAILLFERVYLNLAGWSAGIATQTHRYVSLVQEAAKQKGVTPPAVVSTRKILPFYRQLCIDSVIAGGGKPHRPNLSSGVLIKENHIRLAGGISSAIRGAKKVAPHGMKIEIEVTHLKELLEAVEYGAEGVLLDNFSSQEVRDALEAIKGKSLFVEVSGGVNEETIQDYVLEGVDVISCGSLTHSVKSFDLSLLFQ